MTIDELIDRMPKDGWRLTPHGCIRRGHCCPITSQSGEPAEFYEQTRARIGLYWKDALAIVASADHLDSVWFESSLRRRLLQACGLEEQA